MLGSYFKALVFVNYASLITANREAEEMEMLELFRRETVQQRDEGGVPSSLCMKCRKLGKQGHTVGSNCEEALLPNPTRSAPGTSSKEVEIATLVDEVLRSEELTSPDPFLGCTNRMHHHNHHRKCCTKRHLESDAFLSKDSAEGDKQRNSAREVIVEQPRKSAEIPLGWKYCQETFTITEQPRSQGTIASYGAQDKVSYDPKSGNNGQLKGGPRSDDSDSVLALLEDIIAHPFVATPLGRIFGNYSNGSPSSEDSFAGDRKDGPARDIVFSLHGDHPASSASQGSSKREQEFTGTTNCPGAPSPVYSYASPSLDSKNSPGDDHFVTSCATSPPSYLYGKADSVAIKNESGTSSHEVKLGESEVGCCDSIFRYMNLRCSNLCDDSEESYDNCCHLCKKDCRGCCEKCRIVGCDRCRKRSWYRRCECECNDCIISYDPEDTCGCCEAFCGECCKRCCGCCKACCGKYCTLFCVEFCKACSDGSCGDCNGSCEGGCSGGSDAWE